MFDFSMSNVTDYSRFLMLLQKEMFTCISDDIKPIGCTFNSASLLLFVKNFGFVSYSLGYMQQVYFVDLKLDKP